MSRNKNEPAQESNLTRLAITALMIMIVIPTLGILYLFGDQLAGKWPPLIFILMLAALGFYLLYNIIRSIIQILKGLQEVSRGEADSIELGNAPAQLKEMAEIINSLNQLTVEFRENAAQLERFIQQFTTLTEITEITAKIPDIKELLDLVLAKAMASTNAKLGTVMLLQEEEKGLEIFSASGWVPNKRKAISLQETLCGKVIENGLPLLVENIENEPEIGRPNNTNRYSSASFLIMPLVTKTATIGAVCLSEKSTGAVFNQQDRQFLTVMLGQIGFAIENARLLKQAREAAKQLQRTIQFKDTQLQDAHRQIIQAEKLSALGQMIAGVAHEINNPLTSVSGFAELLLIKDLTQLQAEDVKKKLTTIYEESCRATKIVQNLLSFAREKKPEMTQANPNTIVEKIVELRKYDLETHGIELFTQLDPSLPSTMLDVDQIQQVLLNLVNNATQAMQDSGTCQITIETRHAHKEIEIEVRDTGQGIAQEMLDRVFDPFFTTKSGQANSGLGLSISYGIVQQHGGHIQVESEEGKGTQMIIHLPVIAQPQTEAKTKQTADKFIKPETHYKVFVVDDEIRIADLIEEFLTIEGYQVTVRNQGMTALRELLENDYDVIVCDVRMPDLDGRQLYREVCHVKPELADRFIFSTGDVADPETRTFVETHHLPLIAKPFKQKELTRAVYEKARIVRNP